MREIIYAPIKSYCKITINNFKAGNTSNIHTKNIHCAWIKLMKTSMTVHGLKCLFPDDWRQYIHRSLWGRSEYYIFHTTYLRESFIRALAALFRSTKDSGKIPIREPSFPSAQFSSTRRNTVRISPWINKRTIKLIFLCHIWSNKVQFHPT